MVSIHFSNTIRNIRIVIQILISLSTGLIVSGQEVRINFEDNIDDSQGHFTDGTMSYSDDEAVGISAGGFNNTSNYIRIDDVNLDGNITIAGWFKIWIDSPTFTRYLITNTINSGDSGFQIYLNGLRMYLKIGDAVFRSDVDVLTTLSTDYRWYHYCFVIKPDTWEITFYIDNQNDGGVNVTPVGFSLYSGSLPSSSFQMGGDILIGRQTESVSTNVWGLMDDIQIYNCALDDPNDISTIMGGGTVECVEPVAVEAVSITNCVSSLEIASTRQLGVEFPQDEQPSNQNVTWTSSNASILSVSNGLVTGEAIGMATITVTSEDGEYTSTCAIEVTPVMVNVAEGKPVNQSSTSGSAYASLAVDGNANTVAMTEIETETNAWFEIDLGQSYNIEYIDIWGHPTEMAASATRNFYVFVMNSPFGDASLDQIINQSPAWRDYYSGSPYPSLRLNLDSYEGRYIRIQRDDANGPIFISEMQVMVEEQVIDATGITVTPSTLSFTSEGQALGLSAEVQPADATNKTVQWLSEDPSIATVNNTYGGVITAVGNGTTNIIATTHNGFTASCAVTVNIPTTGGENPVAVAGNYGPCIIAEGETTVSVGLDGSASSDDGSIVLYQWLVDGTVIASSSTHTHDFSAGTYNVMLRVQDDEGLTDEETTTIIVYEAGSSSASSDWQPATGGIHYLGNVGIGTSNITAELTVDGTIETRRIDVTNNITADGSIESKSVSTGQLHLYNDVPASDYVFEPDYGLMKLPELESFVKENKHLPEVPSAAEFNEKGYKVGEMDDLLLRKIEELTLYILELEKRLSTVENK